MANHGLHVSEKATSVSVPLVAKVGIPFVIGVAPIQSAESRSAAGDVVLCTSFAEAKEKLGYSDDWKKYKLCEFIYSHFMLYGRQPVIFCNMLDPLSMKAAVAATDLDVADNKVLMPIEAINDDTLVVKPSGGGTAYEKDTDYSAYYAGENLIIEVLPGGAAESEEKLNIAYSKVTPDVVTANTIAGGMENIEKCLTSVGIVPDLIVAPGYSDNTVVAAVMATKAAGINGIFKAKAIIDLSTEETGGATTYTDAMALKKTNNFFDENQIVCWPMLRLGDKVFHMSTQLAGLMSKVDGDSGGIPYESPSNKAFKCDSVVLASGKKVTLTHAQANILEAQGVVTALQFIGALVCWGNYTACYPTNTDVKDMFVPVSRMFDWVGNTCINTFWGKLDKPMNSRLRDNIVDTCNIWLNGIVGGGYLLGARVEVKAEENPLTDLMAGIIRIHIYITPPSPFVEGEFILEYDTNYVVSALAS